MNIRTARTLVALSLILFAIVGLAFHTGTGTICQYGVNIVNALCPLGGLETMIASHTFLPRGIIGMLFVLLLILVFGRAFCSWMCPTNVVRRVFGLKNPYQRRQHAVRRAAEKLVRVKEQAAEDAATEEDIELAKANLAAAEEAAAHPAPGLDDAPAPERGGLRDTRIWVLIGTFISTAICGIPVFCLVCPVGLTFASVTAIWRAVQFGETTWSILVWPALLVLEMVILRRWCHTLCPLGALVSLVARKNPTFKVNLNTSACLRESKGVACDRCVDVCPEGIDLHPNATTTPHHQCLKCGDCTSVCPAHAITFSVFSKLNKGEKIDEEAVE